MLTLLLILLYSTAALWCLVSISRNYRNYLSTAHIYASFGMKVLFGLAYGYIFLTYYQGDDTWKYHELAVTEYKVLLKDPLQFFANIIDTTPGSMKLDAVYNVSNSFWNNLEEDLFIRMLALFDLLSGGNYYVNVVLFCFVVYLGNLCLFRVFIKHFPGEAFLLRLYILYVPAIVFWLSGIRKDGVLFLAFAVAIYYFDKLVERERRWIKNLSLCLFAFCMLFLMRNFLAMCLLPALVAWFAVKRFNVPGILAFTGVYLVSIMLFFNTQRVPGLPDLAQKVTDRQHAFMALEGKTRLPLDSLDGSARSFLRIMPQALNHTFLRPYVTEARGVLQLVSAGDIAIFFFILALAVFRPNPGWRRMLNQPLVLCCLFTAFFGYLLIGYTVPFPGAAVRYKVIFEMAFLCSFAILTRNPRYNENLNINLRQNYSVKNPVL